MRDLTTLTHHPLSEQITNLLCDRTQNTNPRFFRIMVSYYMCKMAATMRVKVLTKDRGLIPINLYAINLAISGAGKGFSTNIIEDQIINQFRSIFNEQTLPAVAEENLIKLISMRAVIHDIEEELAAEAVRKEYDSLGKLAFSFDSATTAAVKQMRHKLLMSRIGAMSLEIDEIGSNLLGNSEVLGTFLELFDMGKLKQKLTKNTKENVRSEEIEGKTPANMLLYGTPAKVFDGAKVEDELWSFISTGYGRRCFFGYTRSSGKDRTLTATEIYDRLTSQGSNQLLQDLSNRFGRLADRIHYDKHITVSKDVSLALIEYRLHCEELADKLGDHDDMRKAELSHRYFKALKLAGAYAFADEQATITEDNLYHAICMAEESGRAFKAMLNQDKNYVRLAKYIASIDREVTHVDLTESLPFYKGATSVKNDLMQLAIAWGYKNSVIIRRREEANIEFITGETLKQCNLDEMYLAYSQDIAVGYKNVKAPLNKLHNLMTKDHTHWINHHSSTGRRSEETMLPGFNMVVLDVDDGASLKEVEILLKEYKYLIYTTKRHTVTHNRFRVILPLSHEIKLDERDFKSFMDNLYEWLPFECDTATGQRSRKWLTNKDAVISIGNGDKLLDAMLFIPRTSKNDERKSIYLNQQSLSHLERWFLSNTATGNRSNQMIKYALMLVDAGYTEPDIRMKILSLNQKLDSAISEDELRDTVLQTVTKAILKRGTI